ncbi:transglutaminase-like protein [Streptomyces sp. SA15]|uniref:transglutaminase-like domain-containing protein n=1 Tax=Streptomyces sp. SA15 TaxID=934019 RepID=UPI000BAF731A|nr:transglutaminase-like domain-containing protein [Streptomyces sp. SA15]PAZ12061.1 transglutaminase-like protein [Streptomyces sp. SA15]
MTFTPAARLTPDTAAFYATQSAFSDPGELAPLYADLPDDPAQLAVVARDLMIHRGEGQQFHHTHPQDRLHNDAETRYIDDILRIIVGRDDAPLTRRREVGDRFVGVCRDFSLLHCSFLRHAGIPARIRSGFADYFGNNGFHCDHVVTEYWDAERGAWLLADAQLADPLVTDYWKVDFDPMDVPRDRFLVAGEAWRAIRERGADPETFGLHPPAEGPFWGERFVAGNVRLDLAALNKVETLLWDVWGEGEGEGEERTLPDPSRELYDRVALVIGDDVPFDTARELFAGNDTLRTPKTVLCMAPYNGTSRVTLR